MKGVEVGNIFDLGTKYSDAFDFNFTDEDGKQKRVLMGCYGIGTTRLVGSVVEVHHDDRGMIWPKSIAPMQVHLVSLSSKEAEVQSKINEITEGLYADLLKQGIEVLWDDRDASTGGKLADADLIGLPLRILISEKTLKEDSVEWKLRAEADAKLMKLQDVMEEVQSFIDEE
jgi:prolyl-tRNA synthetase